ncbi:MAG: Coenzyme F420 hydrogenase/dehydrogenase, beta subunit C-terminal domain [Lachnospiraceae bacterium]|nr:Coenzyme F420 hydrogenase/dehydrogenase, beta subunit C-terminal domain [Lachnospiraceae bacterium]
MADITLGDFWGLDGTELDDNLGTSAIICRTRKGIQLFNRITDRSVTRRMDLNNVKRGNQCYSTPVKKFSEDLSESFFESLEKYGYKQALQLLNNKNALTRK